MMFLYMAYIELDKILCMSYIEYDVSIYDIYRIETTFYTCLYMPCIGMINLYMVSIEI